MTRTRTLTGRQVLFIFLTFFITVTGVNALMVTFAIQTFSGEDVSAAYVKGLNYNATLAARESEAQSGYAIAANAVRTGETTKVTADITRAGGDIPVDINVIATLRHPTNAHLDRVVPLSSAGNGQYAAEVAGLALGQWDLVIAIQQGDATLYEARTREWLR